MSLHNRLKRILIDRLVSEGFLRKPEDIVRITPTHGPCCTCQTCGHDYDDCACEDKWLLDIINDVFDGDGTAT